MEDNKIIIAFLWISLSLIFLLGDTLRIYSGDAKPGEINGKKVSKQVWLPISMMMVMSILMIPLSIILINPVNRILNIGVSAFFLVFNIISLSGYSPYDKFLLIISFGLNVMTIVYALNMV